jgi:hypothetical protein
LIEALIEVVIESAPGSAVRHRASSHDFRKVVDVFARRLAARDMKSDTRNRG